MLSPPQEVRLEAVGRAISGAALMIFAGLLSARKKVPRWNIGSARAWLKGHIWLSLLSVPLIFYHAGFRWGGLIEQLLMLVFVLVVVSGMIGLLLQQYLPRLLKTTVDAEAMFDQIPYLCGRLRETADEEVAAFCGDLVTSAKVEGTFNVGNVALAEVSPLDVLREFYVTRVRPFLTSSIEQTHQLDNTSRAAAVFARVKTVLPEDESSIEISGARKLLDRIEAICGERRQLSRQTRIHRLLHGWLLVHVPLSFSLLVLGIAHVLMSLLY